MNCTFRTQDERYKIEIRLKAGHEQSDIARVTNRHKSSISREFRRKPGLAEQDMRDTCAAVATVMRAATT